MYFFLFFFLFFTLPLHTAGQILSQDQSNWSCLCLQYWGFREKPHNHPWQCQYVCMHAQLLQLCQLFATPWTVVSQALLIHGILQAIILKWVAMPSSRGSSLHRDQTCISCIEGRFFYRWFTGDAQCQYTLCLYFSWVFHVTCFLY